MNINDIKRQTDTYGNGLMCAGMGLETLSNILGADGCEHSLDTKDITGLLHAVHALGLYVKQAGCAMCSIAETLGEHPSATAAQLELRA